jgi:hypothetical protein
VLQFVVPLFGLLQFVEGFEREVGIFFAFGWVFLIFDTVVFVVVQVAGDRLARHQEAAIVECGHAYAELVGENEVAVEHFVGEIDINSSLLELITESNCPNHIPG